MAHLANTAVVPGILDKEAVPGQDKALRGPWDLRDPWGNLDWAAPCSLGNPVKDNPAAGNPVEVGPGLDILGLRDHCRGMVGAAQNSSLW